MANQGAKRSGRKTGKRWLCFRSRGAEVKAERRQLEKIERRNGAAECVEIMKNNIKIKLVPHVYAGDLTNNASEELMSSGISTHYQNDIFHVEWSDDSDYPNVKSWLISTYGEDIKKYNTFAISAT